MRRSTQLLASAALLTALVMAPTPAKADPTLAVALGGSALLISLAQTVFQPSPQNHAMAAIPYYPQPVIYQTVSPMVYQQAPVILIPVPR
ncbi:MAG: hypothetical protein HQM02_04780 [Magnetococcales bacterium]|nr:hypothetical protein [Magnetococcales bacterium]